MPFKFPSLPGRSSAEQPKQEASLEDILPSTEQRVELVSLITACIDYMRNNLAAALDDPALFESTSQTNHGSQSGRERPDLSSTQMLDLKRAGVEYMDNWRSAVLTRIGEGLSLNPDAIKSTKSDSASRKPAEALSMGGLPFPQVNLPNNLQKLDEQKRALVLGAILFMLISLERYPAHSRVLMAYLCHSFDLPHDVLSSEEATTAVTLLEAAAKGEKSNAGMDGEGARQKLADLGATGRRLKIGLATVAGAVVIGITGGLAAPFIIGVAGAIMGGLGLGGLAALLGAIVLNPVTIAALFGGLGAKMTSSAMTAYSKQVEDFKFLPISEEEDVEPNKKQLGPTKRPSGPAHKLRVAIGISGWIVDEADISRPWLAFSSTSLEPFALQYEKVALMTLGTSLNNFLKDNAYSMARSGAIKLALPALSQALAPVGLLNAGQFIDNPFTIAMERSDKAGKVLAHALMDKVQGERPVTLIGFSLGARVVFTCLEELAAHNAFGLIEHAILMGAPVPSTATSWRRLRAVVAGRLTNIYTQKDMILGYLYRARNLQLGIAGLQPIPSSVPGIENEDVSSIVTAHHHYRSAVGPVLQLLNFADLDPEHVRHDRLALDQQRRLEANIHDQAKRDGRLDDVEDEHGNVRMAAVAVNPDVDGIDECTDTRDPAAPEQNPDVTTQSTRTPAAQPTLPPRRPQETHTHTQRERDGVSC